MYRLFALFGAAVLTLLASACAGSGPSPAGARNVLRVAMQQDPKTLDPILASTTDDGFIQRLMFEPLISADEHGRPVPILATSVPSTENGGVSPDGLRITYHLRPKAQWSDGKPVTSADVKFSYEALVNPANNVVSRHGYDDVASVQTPDAHTVIVRLKKPLASFVNTFFAESDQPYEIVPAHVLAKYKNLNEAPFNGAPTVSDGPFTFVRWAHGDRVVLAANDKFFLGKPKLSGIELLTVANESTAVNLLRTGAVQYIYQPSIVTYPSLRNVPNVHVVWNQVNGYEGMQFNLRRKPMSDPRFREAIAYAIDKAELVKTLTYGQEKIATEDLPDWLWASNPALRPHPYDAAKARALIAQMGLKSPVSLVLVTDTANATHKREAVMVQAMLQKVGIDVEIKTYPADLLYAPAGMGGILNGGKFDLALWPWYSGLDPDNSSQFSCANVPPNGYNESGYCNKTMEALQTQALTHYDRATRTQAYHRIEALLAHDNPLLVFWWTRQQEALSPDFRGFAPNPVTESWNAWQWQLNRS